MMDKTSFVNDSLQEQIMVEQLDEIIETPNKGAVKKLPVIAPNTKSFTPISPDLAISSIAKDANI